MVSPSPGPVTGHAALNWAVTLITLHLLILTLWSIEITSYVYIGIGVGKIILLKIVAVSVFIVTDLSILNQQVNFNSTTLSCLIHVETLWKVFHFIFLLENYQLFVLKTQKVHPKKLLFEESWMKSKTFWFISGKKMDENGSCGWECKILFSLLSLAICLL